LDYLTGGTNGYIARYSPMLKKVTLPLSMANLIAGTYVERFIAYTGCLAVEEVSTCNDWGTNYHQLASSMMKQVKVFDQPTLRLNGLSWGSSALEYIDIDWTNTVNNGVTLITLSYNQMDATELDRIFTALPTVTGSETSTVTGNPGAATCTPSIAEAKGWTVTT
ncbi:MAG: hypothetical protein ACK5HT_22425, partial [Draconibacterium sp.]